MRSCTYRVYSFDIAIQDPKFVHMRIAAASIRKRRLFCSARPEVQRQFESSDYFVQHVRRCRDNSRVATNRERHLIEQIWYVTEACHTVTSGL